MNRTTTPAPRLAVGIGLALIGLLGPAGCARTTDAEALGSDPTTSTRPATAATAPSAAPSTSTDTATSPEPAPATGTRSPTAPPGEGSGAFDGLPAGTHHGFIEGVDQASLDGRRVAVLGFDKAELLTGEEAVAAARAAGVIGPDEQTVPNDAFVSNVNPLVRRLAVADGAPVLVLEGGSSDLSAADLATAASTGSLFEVTVSEVAGLSRVTSVTAVYLP